MESMKFEGGVVSVEDTAQSDRQGRPVFEWTVRLADGSEFSEADLCGPRCGREPSEREMLATLFTFLSAAAECRQWRERAGEEFEEDSTEALFPAPVVEWAASVSDELSMAECEIEETL
jgi:hypothetical protein